MPPYVGLVYNEADNLLSQLDLYLTFTHLRTSRVGQILKFGDFRVVIRLIQRKKEDPNQQYNSQKIIKLIDLADSCRTFTPKSRPH